MRIASIQSYNNSNNRHNGQPSFKAELLKKDVSRLLDEIQGHDADLVPKLYTLLEYLKSLDGKKASFYCGEFNNFAQLHIDNKEINSNMFINAYSALYSSLVTHKDSIVTKSSIIRMPESIFEQKWWKNRNKTEVDIKLVFG